MNPRFQAFALHLAISALIALAVIGLVFFIWYPAPLASATGVTRIFLMLLAIDVILGPSLTLLVYKPGKKTLVFDLAVIACLQLAALSYGLYAVAEGRPAWLVFSVDRFELVRVNDIDEHKLDEAPADYRQPSWLGPQWVAASNPVDSEARNELMFEALLGGTDIAQRPNLYQPLTQQSDLMRQRAQPLSALHRFNAPEQVQRIVQAHPQANGWLPLRANNQDMVVLMHKASAEVVAIVDLRPWD